ncbi:pyridoxal phosphate biosynthetic protein PdxA [Candidatus Blochmanniella floridana]|uniref:4-hydroxythreonine-4-phosphate dehydrogenase n=1 Tax=Blochmanniella floridana TaxID=203907 RepID=Q7VQK2_BLOFL|nr:pyridoxal phosphate biosynthetic protein PdxA [Candidatus Blochmannia floridanus]
MINMNQYYNQKRKRIIITPGEPAGIGPDIVIMALQKKWPVELVICADLNLLLDRAKKLQLPLTLQPYYINTTTSYKSHSASILHIPLANTVTPGQLDTTNNHYVLKTLNRAAYGCINGEFSALVTGPVNKAIINQGGISFSGHTEWLAKISKCKKTIMMLSNKKMRVALVTTHIPISAVSSYITQKSLIDSITILTQGLQKYFNILKPTIYVCGLNPHSGESGYIGQEEIKIIIPTLNHLKQKNNHCHIIGPLPADTIFQKKYLSHADVILAMYHDQGLPVLKYSGFGKSINITLGLPFIRTSVDHGSAINLSESGVVKCNSMIIAIKTAINMIKNNAKKIL